MRRETSAGGIVYKKEGGGLLWLIIQNSTSKHWGFPKGLIGDHQKESMEQAAIREVKEEGGINTKIIKKLTPASTYVFYWQGKPVYKTVWYFLMEYLSGDPKNHDWEVSEAKFVNSDEVLNMLSFANDKKVFKLALKEASKLLPS